ncbi:MAG: hypothetical protein QW266_02615 [Sulfolobales archaeon]
MSSCFRFHIFPYFVYVDGDACVVICGSSSIRGLELCRSTLPELLKMWSA